MTINVRAKGATGELEVAKVLQQVANKAALLCGYSAPTIRRNVEQSQVGGEDLVGLPWYSFEVKRVERVDLERWWEQTCVQARRKAPGGSAWEVAKLGGWKSLAAAEGSQEAAGEARASGMAGRLAGWSKSAPEPRVPVLFWRQSRQPWRVRCPARWTVGSDARRGGLGICVFDWPLEGWLGWFEADLVSRLRGLR